MKKNLYRVTYQRNGTHEIYVSGETLGIATSAAYIHLDNNGIPGVSYAIVEIKYIGEIIVPLVSQTNTHVDA